MAYLKAYDKDGNLIAVGEQAKGDKGYITLKNLEPHKKYEQGSFTIKWVSDDFETEGIFSPEFSTHDSEYKEFMFYTKDILKVQGLSAYQSAVKNGYTGTEEEWVQSIKGDPLKYEDLTDDQKEELKGLSIDKEVVSELIKNDVAPVLSEVQEARGSYSNLNERINNISSSPLRYGNIEMPSDFKPTIPFTFYRDGTPRPARGRGRRTPRRR